MLLLIVPFDTNRRFARGNESLCHMYYSITTYLPNYGKVGKYMLVYMFVAVKDEAKAKSIYMFCTSSRTTAVRDLICFKKRPS